jgi:hypothetical protein
MDYDEAKDEALTALSAVLDQTAAVVRTALMGHGLTTRIRKIDYVAQVIVLTFDDRQPTSDMVDVIGEEVRYVWPEMPEMTATLFKVSKMNADLILDLNSPSGIQSLAEAGNVKALAAVAAGHTTLPVVCYSIEKGKPKQEKGTMTVHERNL